MTESGSGRSLKGRNVQAILQTSDGALWVGTAQGDLARLDLQTMIIQFLDGGNSTNKYGAVTCMVEAGDGKVWIGKDSGVELRDMHSGRLIKQLQHNPDRPGGLAANEVTALLRGQDGWIWIAGFGLGLQRHDPGNTSMQVRAPRGQSTDPLTKPDIRSLVQLRNGDIWAATHTAGVGVMSDDLRSKGRVSMPGAVAGTPTASRRCHGATA